MSAAAHPSVALRAGLLAAACLLGLLCGALPAQDNAPPEDPQTSAEELFQAGRKAMFQGQYEEAVAALRKAVEADAEGKKTIYRLQLARALRYAKQPEEAEKLLAQIIQQSPDHVEAAQLLAEIYYAGQQWEQIAQLLEPLLKYRHDYLTYHYLAEATYNLQQYEKARQYYKEAIKLNPRSAMDHYQLANIYLTDSRFALASASYEEAIRLGLDSTVVHYKLASAYFNLRNYFGQVAVVTVAAGAAGAIDGDWYLIEPVPGRKDTFRAAPRKSAIYQITLSINGGLQDRADIQMLLANIHLNARRYQQAYQMYKQLGDRVEEQDRALYLYYFAQSALGVDKYDEYLSLLREAVELDKDAYGSALVDAYVNVADKHNQAGQLDQYIEYLSQAVRQSPETASLHLKLGDAFEEARQYDKAVQQWRMVLDLEPEHPDRTELLNRIRRREAS